MSRSLQSLPLLALLLVACGSEEAPPVPGTAGSSSSPAAEEAPLPERGPRIEGDFWLSVALGLRMEKPQGAVFVPGSSLVAEADERVMDRAELWRRLDTPGLNPVVKVATSPEGVVGRDLVAWLHVIPLRAKESLRGLSLLRESPLPPILKGFAGTRVGENPGFEVVEPEVDSTLAELPAAVIGMRYDTEQGPVYEQMHVTRRWHDYWYLRVMVPEPVDEAGRLWLEAIPTSFALEPDP